MARELKITVTNKSGDKYSGTYTISYDIITVTSEFGQKSAKLMGGMERYPEILARGLLLELIPQKKPVKWFNLFKRSGK